MPPHSPSWGSALCTGAILLGSVVDSPPGQSAGCLRGLTWQRNEESHKTAGAGASKKGGQGQEDTYGERRRLPKGKFAPHTQLCSGRGQEDSCARAKGPQGLLQGLIWTSVLEGQEQTGFKVKGLAGRSGPDPSPLSPLPTGTYKTLVTLGR